MKNAVSFAHAQVNFALMLAYNQYDKIDKWSGAYLSKPCELELNGEQFRVHHEVEIVKNVVSFAHAQVDFALIFAPSAYNQYDKIDKSSGAYLSDCVS